MTVCAVIPAAGRGSRLGLEVPKILVPLVGDRTVWTVLRDRLRPAVDRIHVVLAPSAVLEFTAALVADAGGPPVSVSVQPTPRGMGDAIFGARSYWEEASAILVVWGDQVHVSAETIRATLALHGGRPRAIGLPLVALPAPYVEYRFDAAGGLARVLQSREGDPCQPGGLGDVGTFLLSTAGLAAAWDAYAASAPTGHATGEVNFLPFLPYLAQHGWSVIQYRVRDPVEARGINTPDDLAFFRSLYRRSRQASGAIPEQA